MSEDVYKKMVLALPEEFFQGMVLEKGDKVIALGPNIVMRYISSDGIYFDEKWKAVEYLDGDREVSISNKLRPLPNQKQLLKIYQDKNDIKFESMSLLWFANWFVNTVTERHDFCLKHRSAETIMLMWVQETCYNMMWDGEKWI